MHRNAVEIIRLVLGLRTLFASPDLRFGRPAAAWERRVLRFLAVRQLLQAGITGRTRWHALSAFVDLLHGASMVVLLLGRPRRYGRIALGQVVSAASLAALELAAD